MGGRRRPSDEPTRLEILLPRSLRQRLDRLLYDPEKRRVPYGEYSRYVYELIQKALR